MPKIGTGYVEIQADWSAFDSVFNREASARLKAAFDGVGAKVSESVDRSLGNRKVHVDVDIDRDRLSRIGSLATRGIADGIAATSGAVSSALEGVTGTLSGTLGQLPVLGTAFTALGESGAVAAPAIAALALALGGLAASFGAAVAGAGALGIALAGALGPVALVGVAVIARLTAIFKAMNADSTASAASLQAVAAAQDQVNSASSALATAQQTLRDQTTAAYGAWADSIRVVKDDLLGVKDAQQGITDANLSTREAEQALVDFRKEAGAAGNAFDQAFKKFTDVNVDTSGLKKALLSAADTSGVALSGDQELKLERLINNVRDAKLREQHATATLGDSTRKLATDRQTEAKFAAQGIRAYPGYTSAVAGLASAQRGLATAQRNSAAASVKQQGELAKLSPIERTLAGTFKIIGDQIETAFGPAITAVFTGLNQSLRVFSGVLSDPKIVGALTGIGTAIGGVLVTLARTFSGPKMREAFVTLAEGGARLVTILGSRVFVAFTDLMTSIAIAALPAVLDLVGKIADVFDRWAAWIDKHPKQFRADIDSLIGSFKTWGTVLLDVVGLAYKVGAALRPIGDAIIGAFARPGDALRDFGKSLGLTSGEMGRTGKALGIVAHAITVGFVEGVRIAARGIRNVLATVARVFTDVVEAIDAIAHGHWRDAWHAVRQIPVDLVHGLIGALRGLGKDFSEVGGILGRAFGRGIKSALTGLQGFAKSIVNTLIGVINAGIRDINKVLGPHDLGPLGHTPDLRIDPIGKIGGGAKVTGTIDTTLPRKPRLTVTTSSLHARFAGGGDGAAPGFGGVVIQHQEVHLPPAPAAAIPDARYQAAQFAREIYKRK